MGLRRFGRSPVVHCGPGMIVALAWLSEQPAEAHDRGGRRRDRETALRLDQQPDSFNARP
jgi:hypothetical protein